MNKKSYTFRNLERDILDLRRDFPETEIGTIGSSVWGKPLYYIKIGSGSNEISYNGAHHGMESITSACLMRFARDFLTAKRNGTALGGFCTSALDKKTSVYIVPMLNPDGVQLAAEGIPESIGADERRLLTQYCGSEDFSSWQANAHGVDLNHNYDALWDKSKEMEEEYGILKPGPTRFSGSCAESEPESRALADFTRRHSFRMVIAFHSQGRVIYHGFCDKEPPYASEIARAFTRISPYVTERADGIASYAGYKDWFISEFNRPGFTVELGEGKNPLPLSDLPQIYKETLPILLGAMTVALP